MFERLIDLLSGTPAAPRKPPSEQLAVALLLLELAQSDFAFPEVERAKIRELLAQRFQLDAEGADALLRQAQALEQESISLYDYVQALNARLDPPAKRELMRMLWQVAYADGRLDKYEEHLLRKLAGLLYVSDEDYIRAKLSVTGEGA
jgi:uncharacterized tellurite resistance protein B-like protein